MEIEKYKHLIIIVLLAAFSSTCFMSSKKRFVASSFLLESVFPDKIMGWTPTGEVRPYNRDNLFDLVNGQAEA